MRVVDVIEAKKLGKEHSKEEIEFLIDSLMNGTATDYQLAAWLMAVYFKGMTDLETSFLTEAMIKSGEIVDLKELADSVVDKHSTGGVGDKVTITLIPLLAACGVPVAKLSGRGLGHTGGTIDKLESIPGFNTNLAVEDLVSQVKRIGVAIGAQTQNLTPADGKLYALRDVTSTVDSRPLIASSVVSKKIASGASNIVLDVKYGSGAFMKTPEDAVKLSEIMVNIGKNLNKKITAVVTSMEEPLGRAIGNSLEIIEAIEFLKGNITSGDIAELTYDFAALSMVQVGRAENLDSAKQILREAIHSGKALDKFRELIIEQGGDPSVIEDYSKFPPTQYTYEIKAEQAGFVSNIDALKIAYGCKLLGAGRDKKSDSIDYGVGVFLNKKTGEAVNIGDTLCTIYSNDETKTQNALNYCKDAFLLSRDKNVEHDLIYRIIK